MHNAPRRPASTAVPPPPRIGIYPETKHPSHFAQAGLFFDDRLLEALNRHGYHRRSPIRSASSPSRWRTCAHCGQRTDLPLVQLVAPEGQPFDFTLAGDRRSYLDLMSEAGLKEIAAYADAIGPHKWMVVQFSVGQARDTGLARRARAAGLGIHVWTLRAENEFLPPDLRSAGDAAARGDVHREIHALLDAGITGLFADQPDLAVRARDEWWGRQ